MHTPKSFTTRRSNSVLPSARYSFQFCNYKCFGSLVFYNLEHKGCFTPFIRHVIRIVYILWRQLLFIHTHTHARMSKCRSSRHILGSICYLMDRSFWVRIMSPLCHCTVTTMSPSCPHHVTTMSLHHHRLPIYVNFHTQTDCS